MSQKTVLKDILSKYAPLSVEMKDALVADSEGEDMTRPPIDITPQESREEVLARKQQQIEQMKQEAAEREAKQQAEATPSVDPETGEVLGQEMDLLEGEDF